MLDLFLGLMIVAAVSGASARLLRKAGFVLSDGVERLVLSASLGLGLLAYTVFLVGSSGFLYKPVFGFGLTACLILFYRDALELFRGAFCIPQGKLKRIGAVLGCVTVYFSLMGALAPAVGQDELCYHLQQPINYVRAHSIYEVPFSTNALWPYLMHMLFTLGVLLSGAPLAKFFHFVTYLLAAGAVYAFIRRFSTSEGKDHAFWGMLVYLLTPGAFIQASFAYVDNALALFVFLACYALSVHARNGESRWAALGGVFAGFAASTKLLGLFVLPLALLVLLGAAGFKKMAPLRPRAWAVFALAAGLSGALWYVRSAILRGNPVFPFYPEFFGGHGWFDPTYEGVHGRGGLFSFVLLPFDLTMHPSWFGGESIGPFYLMLLPLVFLAPLPEYARKALSFAAVYALIWFAVDPNVRFFYPALVFLAAACAAPLASFMAQKGAPGVLFRVIFIGGMALQACISAYHFRQEAAYFFRPDPDGYLLRHERSYTAAKAVNRHLRPSDGLLSVGEVRGYYFDNPFTLEGDLKSFTHYGRLGSAGEAVAFLKHNGFTHVLSMDEGKPPLPDEEPWELRRILRDDGLKAAYFKEELVVHSGPSRYVLYRIL